MSDPSEEFWDGTPLLRQERPGEFVPLRLVHPQNFPGKVQVRWLCHDQEICVSNPQSEADGGVERSLRIARQYFLEQAREMTAIADRLATLIPDVELEAHGVVER